MNILGTTTLGRINLFLSLIPWIGVAVSVLGDLRPGTFLTDTLNYLILCIPPLSILFGCVAIYFDKPKKIAIISTIISLVAFVCLIVFLYWVGMMINSIELPSE